MTKKRWNKKEGGWIGEQYNHPKGSSIERLEYNHKKFDLSIHENEVMITLSTKQLKILMELLKEFDKEETRFVIHKENAP